MVMAKFKNFEDTKQIILINNNQLLLFRKINKYSYIFKMNTEL